MANYNCYNCKKTFSVIDPTPKYVCPHCHMENTLPLTKGEASVGLFISLVKVVAGLVAIGAMVYVFLN